MTVIKYLSTALFLCIITSTAWCQQYFAVADGAWSDPSTWANARNGVAGTGAGSGFPQAGATVFTEGYSVTVDADYTITNLAVRSTNRVPGVPQLVFGGLFDPYTITITNALSGVSATGSGLAPTESVIEDNSNLVLKFTTTATNGALVNWSYAAPINSVVIEPAAPGVVRTNATTGRLAILGQLEIRSGATFRPGENVADASGSATISVLSGGILDISTGSITGSSGTNTTSFNELQIAGTVTISGATEFLNVNNITLNPSASFNINSTNPSLTSGWWHTTFAPNGTIALNGTTTYGTGADQTVASRTYSNLVLSGSGTKTASSGAVLEVVSTLTIGSGVTLNTNNTTGVLLKGNVTNSGIWTPSTLVRFEGTGAQILSGNVVTFGAGLDIGNSTTAPATILDLADNIDVNGRLRIFANATLDQNENTVFLAGDLSNSGTITNDASGGATFQFDGVTTLISGSSTATLPNIIIGGGTLSASAGTLNVTGNFTNNSGTFNANNGTLNFNGTTPQTISGTAITVRNLTISNSNGVTNNCAITLQGALTLSATGVFDADGSGGSFTIASTGVNSSGRIAALPSTNNFSGNITVQRFINGPDTWRYLSFPLRFTTTGASINVGQWKTNFPVTGNYSDPSSVGVDGVVSSTEPSIYRYNAATQAYVAIGSGSSTGATNLDFRTGYSVYPYKSGNFTISVSGQPLTGSVSIPLSAASPGWNLIPNPYPSPIDWDNLTTTGTDNSVYMTTEENAFATYVKGSPCTGCDFNGGWTGEIAIGQSFWIKSTGATALSMSESAKAATATFVREAEPENYFRIVLQSSSQTDDAVIRFENGATNGADEGIDAAKRKNGYLNNATGRYSIVNISTFADNADQDLAINVISPVQCTGTLKLKIADVAPGSYSLKLTDLDHLDLGYEITLMDNFLGTTRAMAAGGEYNFSVTTDPLTYGASRFELQFNSPSVDTNRDLGLSNSQECNSAFVKLEMTAPQPGIQYLFKLNDTGLHEPVITSGSSVSALVNKSLLSFGTNKLTLVASSVDGCHSKIFNDAMTVRFDEIKEISNVTSAQHCGHGALTLSATGAPSDGSYHWYERADDIEAIEGAFTATFVTPVLNKSKTYYVSAVNASGCESFLRVPVEAKVIVIDQPEIAVNGNTMTVNATTGIQWMKNGSPIQGATGSEYVVKSTGNYTVTVSKDGCTASSQAREFIVTGVEDVKNIHGYSLFPNPTSDYLYISGPSWENSTVQVYGNKGDKINLPIQLDDNGRMSVDLRNVKKGLYLIHIQSKNKIIQLKAIKK
jgi:hypothetical protein